MPARARWDPSKHPRGSLGRFASVASSRRSSSDLSIISGQNPWGAFGRDADEIERLLAAEEEARGTQRVHTFHADLLDEQARDRWIQGQPITEPMPPRPDWTQPATFRGGLSGAEVERDLQGYANGELLQVPYTVRDLSDGGALNDGVQRFSIAADAGPRARTEVVQKRVHRVSEADAEILASEVGHAIGAPSPVVVNGENRKVVAMEAVRGSVGAATTPIDPAEGRDLSRNFRDSAARLAIADQLTGNRDRHDGNWVMTSDGTVVGIDNGLAWGAGEGESNDGLLLDVDGVRRIQSEYMAKKGGGQQVAEWVGWRDRVSLAEMESWGPRLEALGPAFEARGRPLWHNNLMENYRELLAEKREEWA